MILFFPSHAISNSSGNSCWPYFQNVTRIWLSSPLQSYSLVQVAIIFHLGIALASNRPRRFCYWPLQFILGTIVRSIFSKIKSYHDIPLLNTLHFIQHKKPTSSGWSVRSSMVWPPYLYNLPSCNSALTDEATLTSACPQMQKTRVYTVIFAPPAPSIQNALLPNTPCLFPYLFQAFAHLIFMRPTLTAWLNTKTSPTTHMYTEHSTLQSPLLCYVSLFHNSYHLLTFRTTDFIIFIV